MVPCQKHTSQSLCLSLSAPLMYTGFWFVGQTHRVAPCDLFPSREPGEWGKMVTLHLALGRGCGTSPSSLALILSCMLILTSLHTLHIPFGAEENDSNQVSLPLPLSSPFLVLSLTTSQLSLIIMEGQRRFKVFCIAIPVSANRDFFFGMGYGQATAFGIGCSP